MAYSLYISLIFVIGSVGFPVTYILCIGVLSVLTKEAQYIAHSQAEWCGNKQMVLDHHGSKCIINGVRPPWFKVHHKWC